MATRPAADDSTRLFLVRWVEIPDPNGVILGTRGQYVWRDRRGYEIVDGLAGNSVVGRTTSEGRCRDR